MPSILISVLCYTKGGIPMNVILFCDQRTAFSPMQHLPEAVLPYCNIPLIAHILRFLERSQIPEVTLIGADEQVRAFVGTLPLHTSLHFAEDAAGVKLSAPTLVLRRLCLPEWDIGELLSLCEHAPVRLLHPDGSPTHAQLHPAGTGIAVPEQTVTAVLSVFRAPASPQEYRSMQEELLSDSRMASFRLGQGVRIGKNAAISEDSVIGHDCVIGEHARISGCILGDGVQVGAGAVLQNCVIAPHALIDREVQLEGAAIAEGEIAAVHLQKPVCRRPIISEEDGIHEGLPRWNTPETALSAGAALIAVGERIAVGYAAKDWEHLAAAAAAGAASQGAQVWQMGHCALPQLLHAAKAVQCDAVLWVQGDSVPQLRAVCADGLPLSDVQRRRVRQAMESRLSTRIVPCGKLLDAHALSALWETECRSIFHNPEYTVEICCGDPLLREAAQRIFGGGTGMRLVLNLSEDGTQASLFSQESGMLRHEQLLLLSLLSFRERGGALALPADFHPAAEEFAARVGGRILRLFTSKVSPSAAKLYAEQGVCTDGVLLFAHILHIMEQRRMRPVQLAELLPKMYTARREISTSLSPQAVEKLRRSNPDSCVRIELPDYRGRLRMLAHARSAEAAAELCGFWEQKLRLGLE